MIKQQADIGRTSINGDKLFDLVVSVLSISVLIIVAYPLLYVLSASFSDPSLVIAGEITLLPKGVTLNGYKEIFGYKPIWVGYRNTIYYAVVGTAINLAVTMPCAYALSRKDLDGRKFFTLLFAFTMFFDGGIIPRYLVIRNLGLINTRWALLLPVAISMWNTIIARTYMQSTIPNELQEAAYMDGCSNTGIFLRVILPLSKPVIAVLTIFYAVFHWNSYFRALLYISSERLMPLQLFLRDVLILEEADLLGADTEMIQELIERSRLRESMKFGIIVVSSVPVLILYPFLQRYFVKGVMIGSIKG